MQIVSISRIGTSAYRVFFKNTLKPYTYSAENVDLLTNPLCLAPEHCKVYRKGLLQTDVKEILQFNACDRIYWRIKYDSGYEEEYNEEQVSIAKTCLDEDRSISIFDYLRHVSAINPLQKEKDKRKILLEIYEGIMFIDEKTAAACYLNPDKHKVRNISHGNLIYPFGCNASQKKAVSSAFEHQVSIVQGPPGTGKTQTILNIIANIVRDGKTVLVVSNNNSAVANIQQKLEKYGLAFIVAPLGSKEKKNLFVDKQKTVPQEISSRFCSMRDRMKMKNKLHNTLQSLDVAYLLLNEDAQLRQELQNIELEWRHFCMENGISEQTFLKRRVRSSLIMKLWLYYQSKANGTFHVPANSWARIKEKIKSLWRHIICRYRLKLHNKYDATDIQSLVIELQILYYLNRRVEIKERLKVIKRKLSTYDVDQLTKTLTETSLILFKASLQERYEKQGNILFRTLKDIKEHSQMFFTRYPVVLSTAFSARSCLFGDRLYDYIIMDEASQVSVETGFLTLTCACNAVIVGDTFQLPNVVANEDKIKMLEILERYNIPDGYDCSKNSFLESVRAVIKNAPETLLREHYRCHPRIINFCNQKFYGGNLLIMTHDQGEEDVMCAHLTVKGNHATGNYNQREIDVVREEILPALASHDDIGIVTPYNNQVSQFNCQIPDLEVATIHKFQGREKDTIIMSVVDNQITPFSDDANMLNVAVSRAKNKFCLVMSGNEQKKHGNIMDLLDYIHYNNCTVTNSKIASIFDYLYEQYTAERMAMLKHFPHISEYASENMTYHLITEIIASENRFSFLKVLCHVPLRQIIKDTSLMSPEELGYTSNYNTHVDFLVINVINKKPVLAIETDGYSFHNNMTDQQRRDKMKDHIFALYAIPLIRLSTKGSGEKERIIEQLNKCIC